MNREQFRVDDKLSTAVKLKLIEPVLNRVLFAGAFNVTTGAVVSTVNVLLELFAELFAKSLQLTNQV